MHEVFVPGRLCLLGEHTDWMSSHRLSNPSLNYGLCVVCATNEGLYARTWRQKDERETLSAGYLHYQHRTAEGDLKQKSFELADVEGLKVIAREGGFFSYVAGAAAAVVEEYLLDRDSGLRGGTCMILSLDIFISIA